MSATKKIAYGIGLLILAAIIVGVFLPARGQVQREILIDAPAATVYVLASDARRLPDWLPWIGRVAGSEPGPGRREAGTVLRWDDGAFGSGSLSLVEREPYERVVIALERGTDEARLTLSLDETERGTSARATYATDFGIDLWARFNGLFMESRAGETLERGLAELATLAESLPRADWSEIDLERLIVEPVDIAYLTASSLPNATALSEAMGEAYFEILGFMDRHGLERAGAPLSISRRFSGSEFVFDAAIPVRGVTGETPRAEGGIRLGQTYGGPVVRGRHIGSYRDLADTHEKIAAYLAVHGLSRTGDAWEAYVSDPARVPEEALATDVYYPIGVSAGESNGTE